MIIGKNNWHRQQTTREIIGYTKRVENSRVRSSAG